MNNLAMKQQDQRLSAKTTGLEDRVSRLSNPVGVLASGYRTLRGNSAESLLSALLREVDETILPRRIKVLTNTDQVAYLHVANRRLFRVTLPGGQMDAESAPPGSAAGMVTKLLEFFTDASKAVVHSKRSDDGTTQTDTGYEISALTDATSMDLASSNKPDPVQVFCAALADHASALITLDPSGQFQSRDGDPAWCQRLENLILSGLADIDAQMVQSLTAPDQPGCIFLSTGADDGFLLVYARSQRTGFLAALPASQLSSIQPAWLASFT